MEYIEEIIYYIDENIMNIEVPEYEESLQYNVSHSKLTKDFKKATGYTLREYLIVRKVKLLKKMMQRDEEVSISDLIVKANYNYTERSFRNHLKKYISNNVEPDDYRFHFDNYLYNRSIFSEVLIRLILFLGVAKPEINGTNCIIKQNVEDTIFQFNNLLSIETMHLYKIFLDLSDLSLSFEHVGIMRKFDDVHSYLPNAINIYYNHLHTLNEKIKDNLGLSLIESIYDWENNIKSIGKTSLTIGNDELSYYNLELVNISKKLKINRDSKFILETNHLIEHIKDSLLEN